jgi:multicomponent Na+:H+ antiporter subunit C
MLELIIQQRFYIAAIVLFCIGIATLFIHPNLIKKIIGLNLMDTAVFLFLAAMGFVDGAKAPILTDGVTNASAYINPVPGGLVLTGIVVAVSTTALFLALTCRLYQRYHSLDLDVILIHAKQDRRENHHSEKT